MACLSPKVHHYASLHQQEKHPWQSWRSTTSPDFFFPTVFSGNICRVPGLSPGWMHTVWRTRGLALQVTGCSQPSSAKHRAVRPKTTMAPGRPQESPWGSRARVWEGFAGLGWAAQLPAKPTPHASMGTLW